MKIIRNLKIRDKLLLVLFLLLVPLVYFVAMQVRKDVQENNDLQEVAVQLSESEKVSNLIHQFQKERARMIAAGEGDSLLLVEARAFRTLTDAAARDLRLFLQETGRTLPELATLDNLQQYRHQLDQNTLDVPAFQIYSRNLIMRLLGRIGENAIGIDNGRIGRELAGFASLVEAKVHLGRIRSLLMQVIREGRFTYQNYASLRSYGLLYEQALEDFRRDASQEASEEVQALASQEESKQVAAFLQVLERNPATNLAAYDPLEVFNLFSRNVEQLKQVEERMISQIRTQVEEESQKKERSLLFTAVGLIVTLFLVTVLSFYIVNLISTSLVTLRKAADRIRLGATNVTIPIHSTDEIGNVADAFRKVARKNMLLARVAQAIGQGNYDVEVEAQSEDDVLSHSLSDMKDNLQRFTRDNEHRNWILSGVSELNDLVIGEPTMERVAEKVISFLCAYVRSDAGILYLHDGAALLAPVASHGVQQESGPLPSFRLGAGQVGAAVANKEVKLLDNVPDTHLTIRTGMAEMEPLHIIILPLHFADTVVGALELGTRRRYTDVDRQFLDTVAERVALTIHTLKANLKTQELLYETQNQAEELESQQEELRQVNAELKASEEELKVSQEELQEKNAELEEKAQLLEEQFEAVETKNKALEDAREAIELKIQQVETVSRYKSEFLANMSHELRTPLNSILILSRLLADNPEQNLNTKQAEHAQIIHKSGADLLRLINDILDLSKIESGMIKLELGEVNVRELQLEPVFQELAQKKKIDFRVEVAPEVYPTITTDGFRLEQILKNFLSNAIKFTDEGGRVTLEIYPVTEKTRFAAEKLQGSAEVIAFAVKDTGIGIPEEKRELVFEAFHQADSSTTRKYGGTGLGLTISKELATILGGEIQLESQDGQGSTFTLYLPRHPNQEPAKAPAENSTKVPPTKRMTATQAVEAIEQKPGRNQVVVLIVEDDRAFNDILADFARAKHFVVHQAYTGQEGLQLAREVKPDAVMLDIHLPDISGWEVLRQIREDKDLRHVNVHVMSAYDREVVGNFQENEEYLPKPVTLEMLNTAFTTIAAVSDKSLETILIVEDNEIENRAVAELLQAHGLQSVSAYSAEEAERRLAKHKVDCIVLDLNLPGMKGYEWMAKLRNTKGVADIPIIIYSGKDLSPEEETKLKEFANTIIIKNEYSYLRLLDEVQLFLHQVNQKLPQADGFKMKLHVPQEILHGKKVLIVDDDVRNVYSLSSLLELQGMEIVVAYDGREALQKLEQEPNLDLVLMDIMMPEMDGIEAIRRIRGNVAFKRLPIIALTAKAMKEDRDKCIEAGASDYIPKPVDTDKLLTLMRVWLYEG